MIADNGKAWEGVSNTDSAELDVVYTTQTPKTLQAETSEIPQSPSDFCINCVEDVFPRTNPLSFDCISVPLEYDKTMSTRMIASCPAGKRQDLKIVQKCEMNDMSGPLLEIIPVIVNQSVIYKNSFCAQCNGISIMEAKNMKLLSPSFTCENHIEATRVYRENGLEAFVEYARVNCYMWYQLRISGIPDDHLDCEAIKFKTDCDADFNDTTVIKACGSYQSPVLVNFESFKNLHCAMCSGYEMFSCTEYKTTPEEKHPEDDPNAKQPALPSFSLLMDFSGANDLHIHNTPTTCTNEQGGDCGEKPAREFQEGIYSLVIMGSEEDLDNREEFVMYTSEFLLDIDSVKEASCHELYLLSQDDISDKICSFVSLEHEKFSCDAVDNFVSERGFDGLNGNATVLCMNYNVSSELSCPMGELVTNVSYEKYTEKDKTWEFHMLSWCYSEESMWKDEQNLTEDSPDHWRLCSHTLAVCVSDCNKVVLNAGEFVIQNGSLISEKLEHPLEETDYTLFDGLAIVCDFRLLQPVDKDLDAQGILTLIGNCISYISLILTFITYALFPTLRTVPGKCIMQLVVALFVAQLLFQFNSLAVEIFMLCQAVAMLQHFAWIAAFLWMNVLAIDICQTFVKMDAAPGSGNSTKQFVLYCGWCWGGSLTWLSVCVLVEQLTDLPLYYGRRFDCWIGNFYAFLIVFALPIGLIILINLGLFVRTFIALKSAMSFAKRAKTSSNSSKQHEFSIYLKLSSLMGFTWIFGFLQNEPYLGFLQYAFILCNTLQGFFVFMSFVATSRVLSMYKEKFRCQRRGVTKSIGATGTSLSRTKATQETKINKAEADRSCENKGMDISDVKVDIETNGHGTDANSNGSPFTEM